MSIGAELADARSQAGLTVAQVSQRTRIRTAIIEAIERDDFSVCGGDFYARGHIRAIARVAGIDPEPLVREYDDAGQGAAQQNIPASRSRRTGPVVSPARTAPATAPATSAAALTGRGTAGTTPGTARMTPAAARTTPAAAPTTPLAAPTTPAAARMVVVTGRPETAPGGSSTGPGGPRPVPRGPGTGSWLPPQPRRRAPWSIALLVLLAAAIAVIIYQVASSGHANAPAAGSRQPAAASRPTPRASTSPAARASPSASPTPVSKNVVISLAAVTEPCWAQLTTQGGSTIYQGIVAMGSSMSWTEGQPVTLTLGNPGAVTLTVNGTVRTGLGTNPVTLNLAPGQPPAG